MELRRTLLIVALAVVTYVLFLNWQQDYGKTPTSDTPPSTTASASPVPADVPVTSTPATTANSDIPAAPVSTPAAAAVPDVAAANGQLISVRTDVLDLRIDPVGGDIVYLALPGYTETIDAKRPFVLLDQSAQRTFVAQSGLIGSNGPDSQPTRPRYHSAASAYQLVGDAKTLAVVLTLPSQNGVDVQKIFTFQRGDYLVKVDYRIVNRSAQPWSAHLFGQLKRDGSKDPSSSGNQFGMSTFLGGAWWTPEQSYNKLALDDFSDTPVKEVVTGGWVALVQHYFVTAWVPAKAERHAITSRYKAEGSEHFIGFTAEAAVTVPAGKEKTVGAGFYAGPKVQDKLEAIAPGLELTVDYGWLWPIAQFLFFLLTWIHAALGNWGWAIIGLTVLVKAAFFHLSAASYKSMANLRKVAPEMQRLKDLYGNDRARMSQEMMELYKKEKINPLGGCLPILVQMPVFIALYWTLMESVELRHADWILWIQDLAAMDPYFVLPLLMGATMFIQQQLNPAPQDPMQAKVLKLMPIIFTFMFLWFPAGLVLYWLVNNVLSIAQQWWITRQIEAGGVKAKAKA